MLSKENHLSQESQLKERVLLHLEAIYPKFDAKLPDQLIEAIGCPKDISDEDRAQKYWQPNSVVGWMVVDRRYNES